MDERYVGFLVLVYVFVLFVLFPVAMDRDTPVELRHAVLWPLYIPHVVVWIVRAWAIDMWRAIKGK